MNKIFDGNPDIESIMSVITNLKEKDRYDENLGDFALFALDIVSIRDTYSKFDDYRQDLEQLEKEYKHFIRSQMQLKTSNIDKAYKIYDNLFGCLYRLYTNNNIESEIKPYSQTDKSFRNIHKTMNFFTTNYDTSIEKYFHDKVKDPTINTGAINDLQKTERVRYG